MVMGLLMITGLLYAVSFSTSKLPLTLSRASCNLISCAVSGLGGGGKATAATLLMPIAWQFKYCQIDNPASAKTKIINTITNPLLVLRRGSGLACGSGAGFFLMSSWTAGLGTFAFSAGFVAAC